MEAVLMNATGDYRHRIGNPKRNFVTNRTLFPYPSDDLLFASFHAGGHFAGGGLLSMPPSSLFHSYPPAVPVFGRHHQQPPLLPLPISTPLNHQNMNIHRSNSTPNNNLRSSPINKNVKNRGRDHSLTPKKSKNQKKNSKRDGRDLVPPAVAQEASPAEKRVPESSNDQMIGPDPTDLPTDVISRVFSSSINKSCDIVSVDLDKFSGSVVFTPSPPPSSLPLPTFSLRPKLSCNAQAAGVGSGVDAGATDSLRRFLRL
ncbi:hypothetical protein R6Q57_021798 [Mikania cordata]